MSVGAVLHPNNLAILVRILASITDQPTSSQPSPNITKCINVILPLLYASTAIRAKSAPATMSITWRIDGVIYGL